MIQFLHDFQAIFVDVWNSSLFGLSTGRMVGGLLIFLVLLMLRNVIAGFIVNRLTALAAKTKTAFDDKLIQSLAPSLRLLILAFAIFSAGEFIDPDASISDIPVKVVKSLIVGAIFRGLYNMVGTMANLFASARVFLTESMTDWLSKIARVAIALVGGAAILEVWGVEVAPILAGLGLFGVAVALGAQDLFKNLISGFLVIAEKRFQKGDWVKVDGVVEGIVETIGFRSTLVRRFDKAPVYVPNARLSDSAVTNFTKMTHRRIYWKVGLEYRTTLKQLRAIRERIEKFIFENADFASPEEVSTFVRLDGFADSSVDLMIYCFTRTTNWGEWLEVKEALAYEIKKVIEEEGASFAFPSQSLYLETLPERAAQTDGIKFQKPAGIDD